MAPPGQPIRLLVNDRPVTLDCAPGRALVDVLRRDLGLVGTKVGCREGDCGACAVLLGEPAADGGLAYRVVCSCLVPVGDAAGRHVVTIEGLNVDDLSPVQRPIVERGATQCGFCTPGIVVAATGYLLEAEAFDEREAVSAVAGNLCRCTGYASVRAAIRDLEPLLDPAGEGPALPLPGRARILALVDRRALPRHFRDAPELLASIAAEVEDDGDDPAAIPVAGATDLLAQRPRELAHSRLRFLSRRPELKGVRIEGDRCLIGAATTMTDLARAPELRRIAPGLDRDLDLVCSAPIRNRATVGGNVVNASPIGDLTICLLALGATVRLARGGAHRELALADLFRGYKDLDLAPGEIVTRFEVPLPQQGSRFRFEKVCRRRYLDIASVNSAIALREADGVVVEARVSAGGVAPIPLALTRTGEFLTGRPVDEQTVRRAAEIAMSEATPIDDVRGSALYKRLLLGRLIIAHFAELFPDRVGPGVLR